MRKLPNNVDEYIADFPPQIQAVLQAVRTTIRNAAPQAEEKISYNVPAYKLNGVLVYFAAYKKHLGFYPTTSAMQAFQKEFSAYKTLKGTIQFSLDKPMPLDLIAQVVRFRVHENLTKTGL